MTAATGERAPSAGVRAFVVGLLVLLAVPGLVGFDAWPLTGWRLFSAARGETQVRWEIEAVAADGSTQPVDLDELPIAYRNAEWPLSRLDDAGNARRDAVCEALLEGVRSTVERTQGLRIVRNHRRQVERDGAWVVVEDRQAFHECGAPAS